MYIETALKNIALNTIMDEIHSNSIYDMYDKAVSGYKNAPKEQLYCRRRNFKQTN